MFFDEQFDSISKYESCAGLIYVPVFIIDDVSNYVDFTFCEGKNELLY